MASLRQDNLTVCKDYLSSEANLELCIHKYTNQILSQIEKGPDKYSVALGDVYMILLHITRQFGNLKINREFLFERFPESFVEADRLDTATDHLLTFIENEKGEQDKLATKQKVSAFL